MKNIISFLNLSLPSKALAKALLFSKNIGKILEKYCGILEKYKENTGEILRKYWGVYLQYIEYMVFM